jgi:hypothetical protein
MPRASAHCKTAQKLNCCLLHSFCARLQVPCPSTCPRHGNAVDLSTQSSYNTYVNNVDVVVLVSFQRTSSIHIHSRYERQSAAPVHLPGVYCPRQLQAQRTQGFKLLFYKHKQHLINKCFTAPVHLPGVYCPGRLPGPRQPLVLIHILQDSSSDRQIQTLLHFKLEILQQNG